MRLILQFLAVMLLVCACGAEEESGIDNSGMNLRTGDAEQAESLSGAFKRKPVDGIRVDTPSPGDTLRSSSLMLRGSARTFESNVQYRLVFNDVMVLARGYTTANAQNVGEFGPFSTEVEYAADWEGSAVLEVYEQDAESGNEVNVVRIPVHLLPDQLTDEDARQVFAYFTNAKLKGSRVDTDICADVYPVRRELPASSRALARGALYYMVKGPTPREAESGYQNHFPKGTRVEHINIRNGVAHVEFNTVLNQIPDKCGVRAVRAQIEQTLVQFPTVRGVAIHVRGAVWAVER